MPTADGTRVAYFRGRKLHGKVAKLPENYMGVVFEKSEETAEEEKDTKGQDSQPTGTLATKGTFDELIFWGHESIGDSTSDPLIRGVEEWISVSEKIHSGKDEAKKV